MILPTGALDDRYRSAQFSPGNRQRACAGARRRAVQIVGPVRHGLRSAQPGSHDPRRTTRVARPALDDPRRTTRVGRLASDNLLSDYAIRPCPVVIPMLTEIPGSTIA